MTERIWPVSDTCHRKGRPRSNEARLRPTRVTDSREVVVNHPRTKSCTYRSGPVDTFARPDHRCCRRARPLHPDTCTGTCQLLQEATAGFGAPCSAWPTSHLAPSPAPRPRPPSSPGGKERIARQTEAAADPQRSSPACLRAATPCPGPVAASPERRHGPRTRADHQGRLQKGCKARHHKAQEAASQAQQAG